jgi:hypothetical protein
MVKIHQHGQPVPPYLQPYAEKHGKRKRTELIDRLRCRNGNLEISISAQENHDRRIVKKVSCMKKKVFAPLGVCGSVYLFGLWCCGCFGPDQFLFPDRSDAKHTS